MEALQPSSHLVVIIEESPAIMELILSSLTQHSTAHVSAVASPVYRMISAIHAGSF